MIYRQGNSDDVRLLKELAIASWEQYQHELTEENWQALKQNVSTDQTYIDLLESGHCIVCEHATGILIGMAFLVPSGVPRDIYIKEWCAIRFVTVHPEYGGQGIGRKLTEMCIEYAKENNETTVALHTSEMMHSARHIYESLGFVVLKEIDKRLGKRYWLYTLQLK
ncbi:MAG: hypothetical protein RLZZ262_1396 [Bacteroidota bacterium]|jgi:ribosomal protein S18 acetylase RimI-like enzyme